MSKKSSPVAIGVFVIGAITLGIVGIMVFGSGRFFRETYEYILYFESDVSGLAAGANVKLKGVSIGSVEKVLLNVGDMSALSGDHTKWYVPVIIQLDADRTSALGATAKPDPDAIKDLVKRGLRAQLASESFVTGVLYVKLDFFPGLRGLRLADEVGAPFPEIPTLPTQLEEIQINAAKFLADLKSIDVKGLVEEMKTAVAAASGLLASEGLKNTVDNLDKTVGALDETLASMRETSDAVREVIDPLRGDLGPMLAELRATLHELRSAAANAGALVDPQSPLIVGLEKALDDAARTAKTLDGLAAMLERQPDALLRGKGPPEKD